MLFAAATKHVGSFQVNITRLILAVLYLVLLVALLQLEVHLSSSQLTYLAISGVIGLSVGDTFLFKAFQEIGARMSMLIMSLAPATAAVLAFFVLDESMSLIGIGGICITIAGISIVVFDRERDKGTRIPLSTAGVTYALLAAAGQGVGLVIAKLAFRESEVNGFVATAIRIGASLAILLPLAVMTKRYVSPLRMFMKHRRAFHLAAAGSVLGPFLGISLSLIAIEHTHVGIAATIMAIVPIIMLPLVRFVYKERLSQRAILGAFAAVAGVGMLFLR